MNIKQYGCYLLCGGLLTACSTQPTEPRKPMSAMELATSQLPVLSPTPTTATALPTSASIAELAAPIAEPTQEINQVGSTPNVAALSSNVKLPKNFDENQPINLNFEQTELRQVIDTIGDALGLSMVIDPSIGDKITLRTSEDNPLKNKDLFPLLQLLLSDAGVSMEQRGGVYYFKKVGPSLPSSIGMAGSIPNASGGEVLQITPLRYITAESALNVVTPLIQPQGRVISLPSLNIIGIIASPDKLERVNRLVKVIDSDPFLHRGMRLFRLQNSKASEVQTELEKILQAVSGGAPAYQAIALERINSIIVVAPPNGSFKEVELWMNVLDERSEDSTEQVFIYIARNLEAKELATTLSDVFEQETKDNEVKKRQDPNNPQQPNQPNQPNLPNQPQNPFQAQTPQNNATNQQNSSQGGQNAVSAKIKVKITADEKTNSLIVRATPRDYRQLLETIRVLDRAPKEVMVNVVIAEVTLDDAHQFGIDWQAMLSKNGKSYGTIGSNFTVPDANIPANVTTPNSSTDTTTTAISVGSLSGVTLNYLSGSLNALLNFVSSAADVRVLSRPSILVRNNEEAKIEVGSREPIPGASSVASSGATVTSAPQYESVGVILSVQPRITDDGIINLKVSQEISNVGGRDKSGNPSFTQRKVETLVVVRDSTPIVIGGLIQDKQNNSSDKIPGLSQIPVVGDTLFSSKSDSYQRTELVLIMVPQIVNAEVDNSPLVQQFKQRMSTIADILNRETFYLDSLDRLRDPTVQINNTNRVFGSKR